MESFLLHWSQQTPVDFNIADRFVLDDFLRNSATIAHGYSTASKTEKMKSPQEPQYFTIDGQHFRSPNECPKRGLTNVMIQTLVVLRSATMKM
jgi:hypothetical protein